MNEKRTERREKENAFRIQLLMLVRLCKRAAICLCHAIGTNDGAIIVLEPDTIHLKPNRFGYTIRSR